VAILLITYKTRNPTKDYGPLYEGIRNNCSKWWHYLDDVWIVETTDSADELAKKLYPLILRNDHLLVVRLVKEYQGWLPKEAWDWLNERIF